MLTRQGLSSRKCRRQTLVSLISVMSIRPAFDQPARLSICAPIWGRKWLVSDDFALASHSPALNSLRHQFRRRCFRRPRLDVDPFGLSLGARCWFSRISGRLDRMKAFSALLFFAIYPILATSQELSDHDQVALHAQKAKQPPIELPLIPDPCSKRS